MRSIELWALQGLTRWFHQVLQTFTPQLLRMLARGLLWSLLMLALRRLR